MFSKYHFAQSHPLDLHSIFLKHIQTQYGISNHQELTAFFTAASSLRNQLNYSQYDVLVHSDFRIGLEIEEKLIKYIQHATLIFQKFKFSPHHPEHVEIQFKWSDAFNKNSEISSHSIELELAKSLYNLSVCMLIVGTKLLASSDYKEQQAGIQKFRTGIWAINEVKQLYPTYVQVCKQIDLSLSNLNILENIFRGWTYFALYQMFENNEKQIGIENIAALVNQTSKHFFLATNDLQKLGSSYPKDFENTLKGQVFYYSYYPSIISLSKMVKFHLNKQEDEPLKGHIGLAVSYLKYCLTTINSVTQNQQFKQLDQAYTSKILTIKNSIEELYKTYSEKNKIIYKQKEFDQFQLSGAPEIANNLKIVSRPPQSLEKEPDNSKALSLLLNKELLQKIEQVQTAFQNNINSFSNNFKNFEKIKIDFYQKYWINFFLECKEDQVLKSEIPSRIQEKVQEFKNSGGQKYFGRTNEEILTTRLQCEKILDSIVMNLSKEKENDEKLKKKYGYNWNRVPSDAIHLEYIQQINLFKQVISYKNSQLDQLNQQKNSYQSLMIKFQDETNPQFKELLNVKINAEFFQTNKQQLEVLKQLIQSFEDLFKQSNQGLIQLGNLVTGQRIKDQIRIELMANQPENQIVQKLTDQSQEFQQFKQNYMKLTTLIEQIKTAAIPLVQQIQQSQNANANQIEQLTKELEEILQLHQQFNLAQKDWNETKESIGKLERNTNDMIMQRELDKEERVQIVENQLSQDPSNSLGGLQQQPQGIQQQELPKKQKEQEFKMQSVAMHKSIFYQQDEKPIDPQSDNNQQNIWESQQINNPEEFQLAFENFKKFI